MKRKSSFTGDYGIVILPDPQTAEKSYEIAENFSSSGISYFLSRDNVPHVTLYHAQVAEASMNDVLELLIDIRGSLNGKSFRGGDIVVFRDYYLFWECKKSTDILRTAHEKSLRLARFLAPAKNRTDRCEEIRLTKREQKNVDRFGHPWCGSLFSPHITLGFGTPPKLRIPDGLKEQWMMRIESVEFARIEYPGRIAEVVPI